MIIKNKTLSSWKTWKALERETSNKTYLYPPIPTDISDILYLFVFLSLNTMVAALGL